MLCGQANAAMALPRRELAPLVAIRDIEVPDRGFCPCHSFEDRQIVLRSLHNVGCNGAGMRAPSYRVHRRPSPLRFACGGAGPCPRFQAVAGVDGPRSLVRWPEDHLDRVPIGISNVLIDEVACFGLPFAIGLSFFRLGPAPYGGA